ncbi:MAG: hypothetical protein SAJ37_01365 [Oscillatoria sp. PMC 1068.18]|nr:hypothetical protein [Oscillatoria sp. PMC 1076.18]MEC4987370.1 hypothetical protein [Oscillatoria sp. PMC 1068.18]
MKHLLSLCLILLIIVPANDAFAETLTERLTQYPAWESKPKVAVASGDLVYPDWMAGTWQVTNILVDLVAPLAPKIITPGFTANQKYLDVPVEFQVRFKQQNLSKPSFFLSLPQTSKLGVISDRAFNGFQIAKAYLGKNAVLAVKVDPDNPNRQITKLQGNIQLISTVTGRAQEMPAANQFVASEVTQQLFRRNSQIYLNEVETTTAYHLLSSATIEANQVTAIYLSPQDPNYFIANGRPVALYRYHLELNK